MQNPRLALRTVAWLTWRQLFARRRAWLAGAIAVIPFLLTFIYRLSSSDMEGDRITFLMTTNRELVLSVLLPLAALVFGTTAFGTEVDDGTIVYALVKPLPRWPVVLVKYLIAVGITVAVVGASIFLAWWSLRNAELPWRFFWGFLAAVLAGSAIYCAAFIYLGLVTRRALIFGLLYVIFFENVLARNFAGVASLSARELSVAVAQWAAEGVVKWSTPPVTITTVWVVGGAAIAATIAAAMWKLTRYEMAERL
jgi:ABC-2 type transport system permease protein